MNKNILIVLGGAVMVAVLVAVVVQMMVGGQEEPKQTAATPKVQILVAAKDLGVGKEIKKGDLKWQSWPKETLFSGAIQRKKDQSATDALEGRLSKDVAKGEPMMAAYILGETKANFVAASLKPGMRAVSINVSAATMVSGFISVGDHVDVMFTYEAEFDFDPEALGPEVERAVDGTLNEYAVERIIENVRVLAIDQTAQRPEDGKIRVGKHVTLELGVEDAERVILAQEVGDLTLVLRGVGDKDNVQRTWPITSDNRLIRIDDDINQDIQRIQKETRINSNIVRIYNGSEVNAVPVR